MPPLCSAAVVSVVRQPLLLHLWRRSTRAASDQNGAQSRGSGRSAANDVRVPLLSKPSLLIGMTLAEFCMQTWLGFKAHAATTCSMECLIMRWT
jgi:hypothetical protein